MHRLQRRAFEHVRQYRALSLAGVAEQYDARVALHRRRLSVGVGAGDAVELLGAQAVREERLQRVLQAAAELGV